MLVGREDDKVSLLVSVSESLTSRYDAGRIVQALAPLLGGKGGGKARFAQAGGKDPAGIPAVMTQFAELVN
jgi:alanyl-tRNA synthetase